MGNIENIQRDLKQTDSVKEAGEENIPQVSKSGQYVVQSIFSVLFFFHLFVGQYNKQE